jgi:large subunit ribosomal protein L10
VRPEKAYLVEEVTDQIKNSESIFVTSYLGLNAENLNALRRECFRTSAHYLVVKNKILKIALERAGLSVSDDVTSALKQSTAVAFAKEDAVAIAKLLLKFGKDKGLPQIKGGYIEGKWFGEEQVVEFSKLPSREILLAKFMGTLKSPLTGFVSVLSATQGNFVRCLKAIADKKSEES